MTATAERRRPAGGARRLARWSRRVGLSRVLAYGLVVAAVVSGIATVIAWTGMGEAAPDRDQILSLLFLDAILLLLLGAVVARRLVRLWVERRRGSAGSGLHAQIVLMFSLVAVTPAILVAVFSAIFLDFGVQAWFSERVRTAVQASNAVAQAYLNEHRQSIRADAFAMANDLNRQAPTLMRNRAVFDEVLTLQTQLRELSEALVVDGGGRVLSRSHLSLALEFDLVPRHVIAAAAQGEIAVVTNESEDRVRAAVKLDRFVDAYLVIGRFVDPKVLAHIERTAGAVAQYERLEQRRGGILITFVMIFAVVSLLLLLAAVWIGLTLATQISEPISGLIGAAERVRKGDLAVRVATRSSLGEIGTLGRAFNRMTTQIAMQQDGLIAANRQLDERRRFTEAVLSGVSAGVIGLDADGRIDLPNRSASVLLGVDLNDMIGAPLAAVAPEMSALYDEARARPDRQPQAEIRLFRDGRTRTLIARLVAEGRGDDVIGFVLTFDDITALVSAQRTAAWADVARRIAHEIKNPLTPIQLSAERLKRKYRGQITTDPETFAACTETIIRQVEDIGRMVDEFSSFARMPRPDLKPESVSEIVRQAVFLERNRASEIAFEVTVPDDALRLRCDGRQISQVLTNILKNASESVRARLAGAGEGAEPPVIAVTVDRDAEGADAGGLTIVVEDNGEGLPEHLRERLTEPYVTTRAKGTGLGLAIAKKIMEDHNGDLLLEDRTGGGARVVLVFRPLDSPAAGGEGDSADDPMAVATDMTKEQAPGSSAHG